MFTSNDMLIVLVNRLRYRELAMSVKQKPQVLSEPKWEQKGEEVKVWVVEIFPGKSYFHTVVCTQLRHPLPCSTPRLLSCG